MGAAPSRHAPGYRVTLNGRDITPQLSPLVELTLTEHNGDNADTLSITLADTQGLALPPIGGEMALALGWQGAALQSKGTYTIDEVALSGSPAQITLHARSVAMVAQLPGKKSRSWERINLEALVAHIAAEHGLPYKISPRLAVINLAAPQQTHESDLHFLSRFAQAHGAIATVKNGVLLFLHKGEALTASGNAMPAIAVAMGQGVRWFYRHTQRETFTGVRARWHNKAQGAYVYEQAGSTERNTLLPGVFTDANSAYLAAQAELARLQRGQAVLNVSLALAVPTASPECPLQLAGFHPAITAQAWVVTRTTHRLSPSGFTTELEAETRTP